MEQIDIVIKHIGCSMVAFVCIILLPFGVFTCIKNDHDRFGRILMFFWVVEWIFATVLMYDAIFR